FITEENKIYKATCDSSAEIEITFIRDVNINEGEKHLGRMLFSKVRNRKTFVYRASDDPEIDGVQVSGELEGCELVAIHRCKLIYRRVSTVESPEVSVESLSKGRIIVSTKHCLDVFVDDFAPFVYFLTSTEQLSVLDIRSMQVRSIDLKYEGAFFHDIVGVHNGEITLRGQWMDDSYLFAKKLEEEKNMDQVIEENNQLALKLKQSEIENARLKNDLDELRKKFDELQLKVGRDQDE
ncbi:hypothetical protein PFISCL1PPCAC_25482, partial [Pristionchus fissidentatus]